MKTVQWILFSFLVVFTWCTRSTSPAEPEPVTYEEASYRSPLLSRDAEYCVVLPENYTAIKISIIRNWWCH